MRSEVNGPKNGRAAGVVLACLLAAAVCSCTSHTDSTGGDANGSPRASFSPPGATAPPPDGSANSVAPSGGALDFTLVNLTGSTLHAIYVSPHDSAGWGENVLGGDKLQDGENVLIRFTPEEKAVMWDLRVEDKYGNSAEWKNLGLREISKITLRISNSNDAVMAEAE